MDAYDDFREAVSGWVNNNSWLAADGPLVPPEMLFGYEPDSSQLWLPRSETPPGWLDTSPSAILAAQQLLEQGKLLSELDWREFERLIAELLEAENWKVELTRGTRDGGIDVIATKSNSTIGRLKTLWQAKRYSAPRKVRLAQVRELSGVLERAGATKGVLVTTSSFTKGAIDWVRQDEFRLSAKDSEDVKGWIARHC